mgnify:CR=1 FL=1
MVFNIQKDNVAKAYIPGRDIGEGSILQAVNLHLRVVQCVHKSADLVVVLGELGLQVLVLVSERENNELGHKPQNQENRVRDRERNNGSEHGCFLSE